MTAAQDLVAEAAGLLGRPLHGATVLHGGEHAMTVAAHDGDEHYVIRAFPRGDQAVAREVEVLGRLGPLGDLVPHLVSYALDGDRPVIVTSRVAGSHPSPVLPAETLATQMAAALARVHQLSGDGLRAAPAAPPTGSGPAALAAQGFWPRLSRDETVLTHHDFWCGNALWEGPVLTGLVDWSGARQAPRGADVAWARQDLVLLGSPAAAQVFLEEYERRAGTSLPDMHDWDVHAAAHAEDAVETWAPNYHGIGRTDLTATVLRQRLTAWIEHLLS
ncbi:phosphotransferase family protein [Luteipulveratus mongoliensis]|uniref:Aminoglycoside phosphotransferase n=1 Tax=Luteipulveratus mongoliensis TaxID=571913 RepID=A0A0K1JJQ5_9MICO|nr:phosphotransferase [Luteipulveratus mongoliensis]AKU16813.1 aminoglycoside phosphotransferase [Luteipulveratus mongoliensis]